MKKFSDPVAWMRREGDAIVVSPTEKPGFDPVYDPRYVQHIQREMRNLVDIAISRFSMATIRSVINEHRPQNDRSDWTTTACLKNVMCDKIVRAFERVAAGVAS
ncbi:hypothetical protein [Komagataeibacter phage phiKX1]|nr:hypothetical protein [Komagataeibacter phage phiKX1]BCZ76184.1 hypothetical protein [Komagataeibacter phage phiKX2]